MTAPNAHDPESLARLAAGVATRAGELIVRMRDRGVTVAASKSSAIDVVTEADRAAERRIVDELLAARPEDGVLGEEGAGVAGTSGITWVIDPIDGTTNYLYDIPAFAVSIAATVPGDAYADRRRAVAAAVCNPRTGELFEAWEGGGARLGGTRLRFAGRAELGALLVGTGFGYTEERRREQAEAAARLIPHVRDIRRIGSAALDLCNLAAGRLDAYYERGLQPWDYAAGALIATEAGAAIIGRDEATPPGEPYLFAGDAAVVDELRSVVLGG